jgi:hypothetical protein
MEYGINVRIGAMSLVAWKLALALLLCEREPMPFLQHAPKVFYMTLQSSPITSLAGPSSGPAPCSTCIPKLMFPAARESISRAESSASMERCKSLTSAMFEGSKTRR